MLASAVFALASSSREEKLILGTLAQFCTTIAWQLILLELSVGLAIKAAIEADTRIIHSGLAEPFRELIFKPLQKPLAAKLKKSHWLW